MDSHATATLRAAVSRLSSANGDEVIYVAPSVTHCVPQFAGLLAQNDPKLAILHQFKSLISASLQSNNPKQRWAGTVLVKSIASLGCISILQQHGAAWIRDLMSMITRQSEPLATKKLVIVTLTRIFVATEGEQAPTREITTPNLPSYISKCLNLLEPKSQSISSWQKRASAHLLDVILSSFRRLIAKHLNVFRPYVAQLQSMILAVLAPTSTIYSSSTLTIARSLYALLPSCALKNGAGEEWAKCFKTIILATHATADVTFRAYHEECKPGQNDTSVQNASEDVVDEPCLDTTPNLGLPSWQGVQSGCNRLVGLVETLEACLRTSTSSPISFPLAQISELLSRMLLTSSFIGSSAQHKAKNRANDAISREEREILCSNLPRIHVSALKTLRALLQRFGKTVVAIVPRWIDLICDCFPALGLNTNTRHEAYRFIAEIVGQSGLGLQKSQVKQLVPLLHQCCDDILRLAPPMKTQIKQTNGLQSHMQAEQMAGNWGSTPETKLKKANLTLLVAFVNSVPPHLCPFSLRARIDTTAVQTQQLQLLLSSTLTPPYSQPGEKLKSSLVPFVARRFPNTLETEGLLRPRMPVSITSFEDEIRSLHDHEGRAFVNDASDEEIINDNDLPIDNDLSAYESPQIIGTMTQETVDRLIMKVESADPSLGRESRDSSVRMLHKRTHSPVQHSSHDAESESPAHDSKRLRHENGDSVSRVEETLIESISLPKGDQLQSNSLSSLSAMQSESVSSIFTNIEPASVPTKLTNRETSSNHQEDRAGREGLDHEAGNASSYVSSDDANDVVEEKPFVVPEFTLEPDTDDDGYG